MDAHEIDILEQVFAKITQLVISDFIVYYFSMEMAQLCCVALCTGGQDPTALTKPLGVMVKLVFNLPWKLVSPPSISLASFPCPSLCLPLSFSYLFDFFNCEK
jgi:hypothetical protein